MKTWITSDLHFGHTNIIKYCPKTRGHFKDADHMNSEMIRMWNERVSPEDLVYILGDVAFMPTAEAVKTLKRLNGDKILIEGNHDRKALNDHVYRSCFKEIHPYLTITHDKTRVVLFHYPIMEWDQMHRGSVHFHGHVHGKVSGLEKFRVRDVGFDATGEIVVELSEMVRRALKGEIKTHHPELLTN